MTVKNSLNYSLFPPYYEVNEGVSLTVPDQTLTVSQILERYTRGLPLGGKIPIYDEEDTLPDIATLDLAERQELREQYESELYNIKAKKDAQDKDRAGRPVLGTVSSQPEAKVPADVGKGDIQAVEPV